MKTFEIDFEIDENRRKRNNLNQWKMKDRSL